jgi:hypothetical protein
MDIGKEDSDEDRIAALSAVVALGEQVFVKVVEIKEDDGSGRYTSPNQQSDCLEVIRAFFGATLCIPKLSLASGHQ